MAQSSYGYSRVYRILNKRHYINITTFLFAFFHSIKFWNLIFYALIPAFKGTTRKTNLSISLPFVLRLQHEGFEFNWIMNLTLICSGICKYIIIIFIDWCTVKYVNVSKWFQLNRITCRSNNLLMRSLLIRYWMFNKYDI